MSSAKGNSSIGRAAVSKTAGWGFKSLLPCEPELKCEALVGMQERSHGSWLGLLSSKHDTGEGAHVVDEIKPSGNEDDEMTSSTPEIKEPAEDAATTESSAPAAPKRNRTTAPVRKGRPTPKQSAAAKVEKTPRIGPVTFAKQSIDELKKVNWPTRSTLSQYFVVVLVFVLVLMALVSGLDALFGWLLLKWLG